MHDRSTRHPYSASSIASQLLAVFLLQPLLAACGGTPPTTEELEKQAFDDLRDEVRQVIEDTGRETAVVGIVDELQVAFTELREIAETRRERIRALNADYDATREQFLQLTDDFAVERNASHQRFQEVQAALRVSVTAEEWDSLERTNTRAMASLAKLIAAI